MTKWHRKTSGAGIVSGSSVTHGNTKGKRSPEYCAWDAIVQRCTNPKHPSYKNYGGRGIEVHPHYKVFENFLRDVGPRPDASFTLDRKNNEKSYEPGNLHWATRKEQQRNRRNCRLLTFKGETKTLDEWAEQYGLEYNTLRSRLAYGWDLQKALTAPLQKLGRPRVRPKVYSD